MAITRRTLPEAILSPIMENSREISGRVTAKSRRLLPSGLHKGGIHGQNPHLSAVGTAFLMLPIQGTQDTALLSCFAGGTDVFLEAIYAP